MSNENFIKKAYEFILGRTADDGGLAYWRGQMEAGLTRGNLIMALVESDEFENKRVKCGQTTTIELNEKLCEAVYQSLKKDSCIGVKKSENTKLTMYSYVPGGIKKLDLNGRGITDISGLAVFQNLEELYLHDNQIKDASEIGKLSQLKIINLNNNQLGTNVDFVSGLTNLERLYLDNNNLENKNIDGKLGNLNKLSTLSIADNRITSIDNIVNKLPSLSRLFIRNNNVENINILNNMNLEKFEAYANSIARATTEAEVSLPQIFIDAMNSSSKVYSSEGFEYTNCKVENQKLIHTDKSKEAIIKIKSGNAKETTFIHTNSKKELLFNDKVLADRICNILRENVISRETKNGKYYIAVGEEAINKQANFDLSATSTDKREITDLTGIEQFPNLVTVNLNNNKVTNLDKLSALKKLKTLSIRYNELENLDGLANVKSLNQLDAKYNYISNINGLTNLTALQRLSIASNIVGDNLQPLAGLSNLNYLNIDNNGITDISCLKNLKLTIFSACRNYISDVSALNKEKLSSLMMQDNVATIVFTDEQDSIELPSVIKEVLKEQSTKGQSDYLEIKYGAIDNNKINLWTTKCNDYIVVKEGNYKGTVVNLVNPKWTTEPKITVEKEYSANNKSVTVTLKSDKPLHNSVPWPFQRQGSNPYSYSATFNYNIENWVVPVKSQYGIQTNVVINVDGVQNEFVPGLKVKYSNPDLITKNVTVTISTTGNQNLLLSTALANNDFRLSADGKSVSKVVTDSDIKSDKLTYGSKSSTSINIMLEKDKDLSIDNYVKFSVTNIDVDAPRCTIEYSTIFEKAATAMIVTLSAEEKFEVTGASGRIISKDIERSGNKTLHKVSIFYINNVDENVTITDEDGNSTTERIRIPNIDNAIDGFDVKMNISIYTNASYLLSVYANENIKIYGDNSPVIQPVSYNAPIMLLANSGEQVQAPYELSVELTENEQGVIAVSDDNNNVDATFYDTSNIDKEAPKIQNKNEVENKDGSKTVTITFNEQIQYVNNQNGWKISEDKKTLTKIFKSDSKEKLTVKDIAGNEEVYEINVDDVNTVKYVVRIMETEMTGQCMVVISTNTKIQEISGWILTEDEKSICKLIPANGYEETVYIKDLEGNSSKVYVKGYEFERNKEDDKDSNSTDKGDEEQPNTEEGAGSTDKGDGEQNNSGDGSEDKNKPTDKNENSKPSNKDENKQPSNTSNKGEAIKTGDPIMFSIFTLAISAAVLTVLICWKEKCFDNL